MKKKIIISVLAFMLLALNSHGGDIEDATKVAQDGYQNFLKICLSSDGAMVRHKLSSGDNYKTAVLGKPYSVELITNESLNGYSSEKGVSDLITDNDTYLFPVIFNGSAKLLLTVRKYSKNGDFQIGALGKRSLARELELHKENWFKEKGERAFYNPVLCLNQDLKTYMIHVPEKDGVNLTPIQYGKREMGSQNQYSGLEETVSSLKEQLMRVVKRGRL